MNEYERLASQNFLSNVKHQDWAMVQYEPPALYQGTGQGDYQCCQYTNDLRTYPPRQSKEKHDRNASKSTAPDAGYRESIRKGEQGEREGGKP